LAPEDWMAAAPKSDGSWWPAWQQWLAAHSSGMVKPSPVGTPGKGYCAIDEVPGQYVRQR
jgi:polyhydroxyalkanoate synthase